ncbi:protein of unknown function [Paraburkholderia dioscoreae]|uniref:Uncharacterized protein n=1 Tax=Paraburkholderia dioscoreae TaxID=2604047 RepID=A0A5Q4Z348_9BURK|nr:protein of unknown function [Paraburkholderia dioscoreae]
MRGCRNRPAAAQTQGVENIDVLAGQHLQAAIPNQRERDVERTGAILHRLNPWMRGERKQRVEFEPHAGSIGNVVQHDRLRARIGKRREVFDNAGLRRPDVVRRGHQHARDRQRIQLLDTLAHARRVIARHADQHRQRPRIMRVASGGLRFVENRGQHGVLLGGIERGRFAGGAERDQPGNARAGIAAHQCAQGGVIDGAVGERRDERNPHTRKNRHVFTSMTTVSIPCSVRGRKDRKVPRRALTGCSVASDGTACSGQMSGCFLALAPTFESLARAIATLAWARRVKVDGRSLNVGPECMRRSVTATGAAWQSLSRKSLDFWRGEINIRKAYIAPTIPSFRQVPP